MRILPALLINATLIVGGCLVITDQVLPKQPEEPSRARGVLCEEVRYELNESVKSGLLTQERANEIVQRCYQFY